MVTSADMQFWTKLEVSEEDATRYTEAVFAEFQAAGGESLPQATQTQAMCYLIASKIDNANGNSGKQSESLGGYSYSRMASTNTSRWLDLYYEVLKAITKGVEYAHGGLVQRVDLNVVQMNRRYGNGRIF